MNDMLVETPQAGENIEQVEVRLATVAEVTNDGLRLQFDGSDTATEKVYKCNASCVFAVNDRVKVTKYSGTYRIDYVIGTPAASPHSIPSGGSTGQVLAKSSNANYAVNWVTPHYVPSGGSSGQVLAKSSNTNYAVSWVDVSAAKLKSGNYEVALSSSVLTPSANTIALGSSSKPFGDLYAVGAISLGANYKAISIGTTNSTLGFFGHTAASRQTVANNATVATLITALKAYGLIL